LAVLVCMYAMLLQSRSLRTEHKTTTYVPGGHGRHTVAPDLLEKNPASQGIHVTVPISLQQKQTQIVLTISQSSAFHCQRNNNFVTFYK